MKRAAKSKTSRVAIVGAGLMGRWHAACLRKAGITVAAICDPERAAADRLRRDNPGAEIFSSLSSCLSAMDDLATVHLCTPEPRHLADAELALGRDLHVLCEKPISARAGETEQLLTLAMRRQRILCPVHQYVFQDGVTHVMKRLPVLGRALALDLDFVSAGAPGAADSVLNAVAGDILPHPLSLARRIVGADLPLEGWNVLLSAPGEFHALGHARQCAIRIRISMSGRPPRAELSVTASRGTVHADLFHGFSFEEPGTVSRGGKIARPFVNSGRRLAAAGVNLGARALRQENAYPGLSELIERFYAAVAGEGEAPFSRGEIVNVARLRDRFLVHAGLLSEI